MLTDADGDGDVRPDGEAVAVGDVDVPREWEAVAAAGWYVPVYEARSPGKKRPGMRTGWPTRPGRSAPRTWRPPVRTSAPRLLSNRGGRLPGETGQCESGRAGHHQKGPDDPRQHHGPPQAAPRPVRPGRKGPARPGSRGRRPAAGDAPRYTRPMPPWPSCPTSRYGPIACGSPGCSSLTTFPPAAIRPPTMDPNTINI